MQPQPRTFLPHVEGLRGLAALYVFLYHVWQTGISHAGATLGVLLPLTLPWLQYGHFAVAVFIVISGYCLGLPVARRLDKPFDIGRFVRRRARRLGPAYLLALVLSPIPVLAAAALAGHHIPLWHLGVGIATHVALIHNWIPALAEYLNGPMWSIALECQIYVVFALLLVPVWRRFGPWSQLAIALALGLAPHFVFRGRLDYTFCWLLALYAMGVLAAHGSARGDFTGGRWRAAALVAAALAVIAIVPHGDLTPDGNLWWPDLVVGAAVALLFVTSDVRRRSVSARVLSMPPLVALGTFSYSLYLIHGPLVILTGSALARAHAGAGTSAAVYALVVPAIVAAAYGFSLVAERPFLSPELRAAFEPPDLVAPATEPSPEPA
jgi:peptidoglycan/LPS O-acetylase OafA/YrhL